MLSQAKRYGDGFAVVTVTPITSVWVVHTGTGFKLGEVDTVVVEPV